MQAPIVVTQATTTAGVGSKPVRVIKVVKPESGQALTIQLGYEQKYKLDLSAIANEKITLVHIGERLIILFDNKATVIVEPFFDSMNAPLPNVTVEAGGRDFSSSDFTSTFPITTDQSVLTAAGITLARDTPPSGADFRGPVVDPLQSPDPLDLLGQEELPSWTADHHVASISVLSQPTNSVPSFTGSLSDTVEEESLNEEVTIQPTDSGNGNEDQNSAEGNDHDTAADSSVTGHAVEFSLGSVVTGGDLPLTFELVDVTADPDLENDVVRDTNGSRVTSFGADIRYVFVSSTLVEAWADGRLIFTLQLIDAASGTIRFTLNDQIDHPNRTVDAGSVTQGLLEETLGIDLSELIGGHDNSGDPITLPKPNMLVIGIIDDTPVARVQASESSAASVDETTPSGDETADPFSYGTPLGVSVQWVVESSGSNPGADGLGSSRHISLEIVGGDGTDSGLTTPDGTPIRLFLNSTIIEGRVDGSGAVAFALTVDDFGQLTVAQYLALRHHDSTNDDDTLHLAGKINAVVTVTDGDGDVATSSTDIGGRIEFIDDAPQAAEDTNWAREQISNATGNVLADQDHSAGAPSGAFADQADDAGSDGLVSVSWTNDAGGTVAGQYGTLTVDAAGNYTYAIDNAHPSVIALGNADTLTDTFTYTIVDGDGDAKTATLTITIFGTDRGVTIGGLTPEAQGGDVSVNEDDLLASRGAGESEGSDLSKESTTQTGSFTISAPDGLDDLVVGGHTVISNGTFVGGTLTTPLGNSLTFTAFNPATGEVSYTYTLADNEAHASGNGTNSLFENLPVVLTDVDGSSATDTLSINIIDDVPAANEVIKALTPSGHDTNLMLILDVSGSMDDSSGLTGLSRLQVMKAAVNELLEQYDNLGDVRVRIVTFSSGASAIGSVWMTVDEAKAAVAALTADGSTNYDAALSTAQTAFASSGKLTTAGVENVLYFMSDGEPNAPSGSAGISAAEETTWTNFLTTNDINSFALGMGTGVTQTALNPIAYDGQSGTNTSSIVVTDMSQLAAVLVGTVTGTTGNLLTDGVLPNSFGADGGYVKSVTVDGTTYTYDPAGGGTLTVSGGPNNGSFNHATKELTVTAASGGVFTVDMDGGTFSYTAPANITSGFTDTIPFVLTDNDGDTAGNLLRIVVSTVDHAPIVRDDRVITNVSGQSGNDQIVIPDFALLFNDSDAEADVITVASVSSPSDGTVSHAGVNVTFTEESSNAVDGGTFTYTATANGKSDAGFVTVDRSQTGTTLTGTGLGEILMGRDGANNTLNANEGDDVLIAGNGNDTLNGEEGNDLLVSGSGNDTLNGGSGSDSMVGGAGNDTYVVDSAADIVVENAGEGTDTVQSSISYTLGANVENLTLTGSANINGTGNALNNVITGNSGNNVLDGGAGSDTINGGNGNDTINGGAGGDTLIGGNGADTIDTGAADDNAQDVIVFASASDFGDIVFNFDATGSAGQIDIIRFTDQLNSDLDDGNNNNIFLFATGNSGPGKVNVDLGEDNSDVEALLLSGSEGVATADLGNASAVAAAFNAEFNITSSSSGADDDALLVINATDSTDFAVWRYIETGTANSIQPGELTLVGIFHSNAAVTTGNFDLA